MFQSMYCSHQLLPNLSFVCGVSDNALDRQTYLLSTTWAREAALSSFLLLHLDTFCSTVAFSSNYQ